MITTPEKIRGLIGDYEAFFELQRDRLARQGIEIDGYPLSHLAFRPETFDEYVVVRDRLEVFCAANVENVWNGRPISKMLLAEPLSVGQESTVSLIEVIPPPHREKYKMGLEHLGVVVGESIAEFAAQHSAAFSGQQHQNEDCEPWYVTFDDLTNVKFYRMSLQDVLVRQGFKFDGFYHAES